MTTTVAAMATPRSARSTSGTVPFLPGYPVQDQKQHQRKGQTLSFGPGGATDTMKPLDALKGHCREMPILDLSALQAMQDPLHRYDQSARSVTHEDREGMRESARNTYRPAVAPAWLKHDRQVLRFNAYFQEPVHENPRENFRVRHCVIYYYLEDGTMMVTEPKVENSGIPQGTFVKRHRIPKPKNAGGGYYTYEDLKCGTSINLYARVFRITDCDDFTRAFYERGLGTTLEPGEEPPMDSFRAGQFQDAASAMPSPRGRDVMEAKEYNELFLGGNRKNKKLEQFLENDRRVLCFKCLWDDPTRYGARMYYTLHFHLSDDTVEMHESLARNSGRDPYPVFWRRSPLRKNPHVSPAPGMLEPEPIICKPEDFMVGECIEVYGRQIYLYDCDEFTRDFYRQYMQIEQDSQAIENPRPVHAKLCHPPHTGFGTQEDSLASCLHLTPRPPRRDINKLMTESDKIMRFEGYIASDNAEDMNRRFVVAVYPADDGVGVWEVRQRNSGHAEGKFALKSKKKNPATGTWFKCQDFQVGAVVEINGTPFLLTRADEGTLKYMEDNCHDFPVANANLIASKLRGLAQELEQEPGPISLDVLGRLAEDKLGVRLSRHELVTVSRAFGEPDACIDSARLLQHLRRL